MKKISHRVIALALLAAAALAAGCADRSGKDFYGAVRGYGWLAEDYYTAVVNGKELPTDIVDDAFLMFTAGAEGPGLTYYYNFHEGNNFKLAGFGRHGEETEAKLEPETAGAYGRREFFRVLERDSAGPLLLARRTQSADGNFFKLYRRVGGKDFSESGDKSVEREIGCLLLCGRYAAPGGVEVVFQPGGKGLHDGKPFQYEVWLDYVLGPRFSVLRLSGFPAVGGEVALEVSRHWSDAGSLDFRRIKKPQDHESSWRYEDKPLLQLKKLK